MKIKMSKNQWKKIGQSAGWNPSDPADMTDQDVGAIYSADEEEAILLGPEEEADPHGDGFKEGQHPNGSIIMNPYSAETEAGRKKFDEWIRGFMEARKKPVA